MGGELDGSDHIILDAFTRHQSRVSFGSELRLLKNRNSGIGLAAKCLAMTQDVTDLDMMRCVLTDEEVTRLFDEGLQFNTSLRNLSFAAMNSQPLLALGIAIQDHPAIESIRFHRIPRLTATFIDGFRFLCEALGQSPTLKRLILQGCGLTDDCGIAIGGLLARSVSIRELDLSGNKIGPQGLLRICEGLEENTSLRVLSLRRNPLLCDGATLFAHIVEHPSLENLDVSWSRLRNCPARRDGLTLYDGMGGELQSMRSLRVLNLAGCKLFADHDTMTVFMQGIAKNSSVVDLILDNCFLEDEGATQLGLALRSNRCLRKLRVRNNFIKYIHKIATALVENSSLWELDLEANPIQDFSALGIALQKNKTLQVLRLGRTRVGPSVTCLANGLKYNFTLESLNLDHCGLDHCGASVVFDALKHNGGLKQLSLMGNNLEGSEHDMMKSLGEVFKVNQTLRDLSLCQAWIPDSQIAVAVMGLRTNQSLVSLTLSTFVNDSLHEGCFELARALEQNTTLQILNLRGCTIVDEGACVLAEAVELHSHNIQHITLGSIIQGCSNQRTKACAEVKWIDAINSKHQLELRVIGFSQANAEKVEILSFLNAHRFWDLLLYKRDDPIWSLVLSAFWTKHTPTLKIDLKFDLVFLALRSKPDIFRCLSESALVDDFHREAVPLGLPASET